MSSPVHRFLAELRHRKVPQVAGVYAAAAFAVMQAADLILPRVGLPDWTVTFVIVTLVLGFPLAVALAWAFQVRPETPDPDAPQSSPVATSQRNVALWLGTAALVLVLGVGSWAWLNRTKPLVAEDATLLRGRVLVMPFDNRTGDASLDPFGSMAAQWIAEGIAQSGVADVVADPVITEQAGAAGARDVSAAGIAARAALVVSGSIFLASDSLRVVAEVTDLTDGTRSTLAGAAGDRSSSAVLVATRERVLGAVATKLDMATRNLTTMESKPPLHEAYRAWSEGIDLFVNRDFTSAGAAFSRAAQLDTSFVTPLLWEVAAYGNLLQRERADSLLRLLAPRRERLLPTDRAQLDYWVETLRGSNAGRYNAAKRMLAASPGSELATYLAGLQAFRLNRPAEAVELLSRLRPPNGKVDWDAYGLQLTEAYHLLGDHTAELAEARRARATRPDMTLHMRDEARALAALGRDAELLALLDHVLTMPDASSPMPVTVIHVAAQELRAHGRHEIADAALQRAFARLQTSGASRGARARTLYLMQRWPEARALFDTLTSEFPDVIAYLGHRGVIEARMGDAAAARRTAQRIAELRQRWALGSDTQWRACIAAVLGDRAAAVDLLRAALAQGSTYSTSLHSDPALIELRGYRPYDELMRPRE